MNTIKLREVNALGATPKEFEASFNFKPLIDFDHPDIIGNIVSEHSNTIVLNKSLENGCMYYVQGIRQNDDDHDIFSCILDLTKVKSLANDRVFSSVFKEYNTDTLLCFYADSYNYLFPYDGVGGEDIPYDILHGYTIELYKINFDAKTPEVSEGSKMYKHLIFIDNSPNHEWNYITYISKNKDPLTSLLQLKNNKDIIGGIMTGEYGNDLGIIVDVTETNIYLSGKGDYNFDYWDLDIIQFTDTVIEL